MWSVLVYVPHRLRRTLPTPLSLASTCLLLAYLYPATWCHSPRPILTRQLRPCLEKRCLTEPLSLDWSDQTLAFSRVLVLLILFRQLLILSQSGITACQACFLRWKPTEGPKHNKPTHHQSKPMQDKKDLFVMEAHSLLLNRVAGSLPYIKISSTYSVRSWGIGLQGKSGFHLRSIYLYFPPSPARKGCMGQTLMSHWFRYDESLSDA